MRHAHQWNQSPKVCDKFQQFNGIISIYIGMAYPLCYLYIWLWCFDKLIIILLTVRFRVSHQSQTNHLQQILYRYWRSLIPQNYREFIVLTNQIHVIIQPNPKWPLRKWMWMSNLLIIDTDSRGKWKAKPRTISTSHSLTRAWIDFHLHLPEATSNIKWLNAFILKILHLLIQKVGGFDTKLSNEILPF